MERNEDNSALQGFLFAIVVINFYSQKEKIFCTTNFCTTQGDEWIVFAVDTNSTYFLIMSIKRLTTKTWNFSIFQVVTFAGKTVA